ncbi:hypothetical protein TGME49_272020 [Toxoplasma gondii ME49]|uniref:Uncharacterized protein n=1 Tax=Toxoplasma gondii (strain ATCC 50611 / Me49) TaxID=508771 RepID=S8EYP7_TOXGM|nr:hypothetical protein TGME49_272020 [Toxoplasma gondii ME49]EPT28556.1 hypothetical protein TGME49_272020 [Toxoplasma gondii ME49]|eukprot:XP_018636678.1 hypothetical protein TGME49_272020 [Toxoplasma gondii ME49]
MKRKCQKRFSVVSWKAATRKYAVCVSCHSEIWLSGLFTEHIPFWKEIDKGRQTSKVNAMATNKKYAGSRGHQHNSTCSAAISRQAQAAAAAARQAAESAEYSVKAFLNDQARFRVRAGLTATAYSLSGRSPSSQAYACPPYLANNGRLGTRSTEDTDTTVSTTGDSRKSTGLSEAETTAEIFFTSFNQGSPFIPRTGMQY